MWNDTEGKTICSDTRELHGDPARSKTLSMYPSILHGSREIPPSITGGAVVRVENSKEVKRR
jgi:hypothetical protein